MLSKDDIKGVAVMVPTPTKEGAEGWDVADSVDLEETARMVESYIRAGIGVIAACGTTGECAALLWEEKRAFIDTIVQVARKRVPVFAGATALGTKEVVRQMRGLKAIGADGAFVGLPLWQTPTNENSVQFFADLGEAVPDMAIMIYANARFFKSTFPTSFWAGVAKKAPTVVVTKMSYSHANLLEDLRVAGHRINFMPGEAAIFAAYKMARPRITTIWSSGMACMGPEPVVALSDAILNDDEKRVEQIWMDLRTAPPVVPVDEYLAGFPYYNVQINKYLTNVACYIKGGPCRAPYRISDLPESWKRGADQRAEAWKALRKKYASRGF
ncbi:MAG TPA: dihydrodipicolinate synthase family protein [Candidatus Binatia bacterium]|jgi:trans-o-hydroxybenzylidenepyruvate hydratase-aldolase|nr:dihydrodipicolinate synthase family protein [Candidatus Binatia bacterium]HEV8721556.1 dihydrodipicolinate synthase family protein [Candidatus Binatia bacterium]